METTQMNNVSLTAYPDQAGFSIKHLGGYTLSIGVGKNHYCENSFDGIQGGETSTMEVAIMDKKGQFVCLPDDVAGHVPVHHLAQLMVNIAGHNWEQVCFLCDEEVDKSKFPSKKYTEQWDPSV